MAVALSESDTRAKLIDPAPHANGWTEDLIKREETAGAIDLLDGHARRRAKGRIDYTLRVQIHPETQPVAVAEAKAEHLLPTHGLDQAKEYAAACKRLNRTPSPATATASWSTTVPPAVRRNRAHSQSSAAIRAVLEKIARGEKRALLSLATGTGKTFIAVHLVIPSLVADVPTGSGVG